MAQKTDHLTSRSLMLQCSPSTRVQVRKEEVSIRPAMILRASELGVGEGPVDSGSYPDRGRC